METQITAGTLTEIEAILEGADANGRSMLFEHEVYQVLAAMEIRVPVYTLVETAEEITPELLSRFSSAKIVLKAAADGVAHKQKAGAVHIVHKDQDFIRYCVEQMQSRMREQGYRVEGILLVECIEYSKDLGNEVMLGFTESVAFGPVISFSKGGSDAEHFARHFSPPNLILAPITRQWAEALLYSTSIQDKYSAEGHPHYTDKIIDVGLKFSKLATAFSHFFDSKSRFVLLEFEVNPFVFDPSGNFIALDGYAVFEPRHDLLPVVSTSTQPSIAPFFDPEGVAVVGVSTSNESSPGSVIVENLVKLGRRDVYCVNPKGGVADFNGRALQVYTSLESIDAHIDLVVVAVPAAYVLPAVQECAQKGVKSIILIPGGFSETGDNTLERQILSIAKENGIRLIGPNCLGVIYAGDQESCGINTFFIPEDKFQLRKDRMENVAIISQSGALGLTEIHNLRHAISPKAIVSYGNALDIDPSDLVSHFSSDPAIDVIGCYIEGFKKCAGAKFFHTAGSCPKPVIVYKAGRTQEGQKATESHTASIAGEYEVSKAAMKQAGLIVADTMMDHVELIKTFALFHDFQVNGNRVAIIANAGYEKTYAADHLGGLQIAGFDKDTMAALKEIMPSFITVEPLLDLTPMADDDLYEKSIEIVLRCQEVDAVLVSVVPHAVAISSTDSEIESNDDHVAARIVRLVHKYKKPVVVSKSVTGGSDAVYNKFSQTLDAGGVPTYLTAGRAMKCLNAFVRHSLIKKTNNFGEWLKHS
ncbi:MAG: hypothetical protein GY702_19950 [Desulfobulbaceae bacterium]|nr:hypothetical protein [Desulfobulbaceae bacterium]